MQSESFFKSVTDDADNTKRVVRTKFDIYVFITITGSIPMLVDNLSARNHPPSNQCFGTDMFYMIYFYS
jgi:hypothetical protein